MSPADNRKTLLLYAVAVPVCAFVIFTVIGHFNKRNAQEFSPGKRKELRSYWAERDFLPLSSPDTFSAVRMKIQASPVTQLGQEASEGLWNTVSNLLVAYSSGNYTAFRNQQLPSAGFRIDPNWHENAKSIWSENKEAFGNRPLPPSDERAFEEIWKWEVSVPFWESIAPNSLTVILTNVAKNLPPTRFMPEASNARFEITSMMQIRTPTFNYTARAIELLKKEDVLALALVNFIAKPPAPDHARPFLIVYLWDRDAKVWLPWQFSHLAAPDKGVTWRQPEF